MIPIIRHLAVASALAISLLASIRPPRTPPPPLPSLAEEEGEGPAHELPFQIINFLLLAGGLGYVLRKPAADFFRSRSSSIQKSLEEGRRARQASEAQLHAVEDKLRHLEEEIARYKASTKQETETEWARLAQATADETVRILEAGRAQMEVALRGAGSELRKYAAQQAVSLAEGIIRERLDETGRQRLVQRFATTLEVKERKN